MGGKYVINFLSKLKEMSLESMLGYISKSELLFLCLSEMLTF